MRSWRYRQLTGSVQRRWRCRWPTPRSSIQRCWFFSNTPDPIEFAPLCASRVFAQSVRKAKGALMSTAAERAAQLDLVARLKSAYPELPDAPTPDMLDHDRITAYLKPVHDVGGEPDAPMKYENKQYELWEHMTYVMCEVLGWRGIWLSEERRRIGNVDVGRAEYLGLPYYGRWLLAVARVLVEKQDRKSTRLNS